MDGAPGVGSLEVRSRRIESGGGSSVTELTVYCPFRQRSLELEQCEECFAHERTAEDAEGNPKEVACRRIGSAIDLPDVAETAARAVLERTPVSLVMARHVVCVEPDLPVRELAGILLRHRISGVSVVDAEFRPIGVVTRSDLIQRGPDVGGSVADVMTRPVTALGERASLIEAAHLMAGQGVHRLPVTGLDGRIIGIVSSLDVLRWLSRELPSGEGVAGAAEIE